MNDGIKKHGFTFIQLPTKVITDLQITDAEFRVYAYLLLRQGQNDAAFPGEKRIASDMGISSRTVNRAIAGLIHNNWIRRQRRLGRSTLTHVFASKELCAKWDARHGAASPLPPNLADTDTTQEAGSYTTQMAADNNIQRTRDSKRGQAPRPAPSSTTETPVPGQAGVERGKQKARRAAAPAAAPTAGTRAIQDAYAKACGFPVPWAQGESKAAKWLADNGYTPEQVTACYASLKAETFWSNKPLKLASIVNQIGEWSKRNGSAAASTIPLDANGREMVLTPSGKWVVAQ